MNGRHTTAIMGSVAAHALLLAWGMTRPPAPPPETPAEPIPIALVVMPSPPDRPLAMEVETRGPRTVARLPTPPTLDPAPPPPRAQPHRATTPPVEPSTPTLPESPGELPAQPSPDDAPPLPAAPAPTPPAHEDGHDRGVQAARHGMGSDHAASGTSGSGALDHSAYGAELVRIVRAEVERDPVPGIPAGHSIAVLMRVLPDGRLQRRGVGRFDFARVLTTTMGPLKTRRFLRRVERASQRFPRHPDGFEQRYYEVAFTMKFTDDRAG